MIQGLMIGKQVQSLAEQERNHGVGIPVSDRKGKWVPRLRYVSHKDGTRVYKTVGRHRPAREGGTDHHGVSRYRFVMDRVRRPRLKNRRP